MSCIYLYMCIFSQSRSQHHLVSATVMTVPKVGNLCVTMLGYLRCMNFMIFLVHSEYCGLVHKIVNKISVSSGVNLVGTTVNALAETRRKIHPNGPLAGCSHFWKISKKRAIQIFIDEVCFQDRTHFHHPLLMPGQGGWQRLQKGARCRWTTRLSLVHPLISHHHLGPHVRQARFPLRIIRHDTENSLKTDALRTHEERLPSGGPKEEFGRMICKKRLPWGIKKKN